MGRPKGINTELIYKQYYLMLSIFGLSGSYLHFDQINVCADEAIKKSATTRGDLSQDENRIEICKVSTWNMFFILFNGILGASQLLLDNLEGNDGGYPKPKTIWALAILSAALLLIGFGIVYWYLPATIWDVAAYRNKDFPNYVKNYANPMIAVCIMLQLFCIAASTFVATMALQEETLEISSYWSAGVGSAAACYLIAVMQSIYFYAIGAGHVKLDIFGKQIDASTDDKIQLKGFFAIGIAIIKLSLLIGMIFILIYMSLLYTIFDCSKYYFFLVWVRVMFSFFVGLVVVIIRPKSPAHLANLLASTGHQYHVFISHSHEAAQDVVENMDLELEKRGIKCCRDVKHDELTLDAMRRGIDESMCVIDFITKNNKDRDGRHITTKDKIFEIPFDVFLSYRVDSDSQHVEELYEALTLKGLKVWWDKKCLPPGKNWEEGFASGLINSATFVCLLSKEAINSPTEDKRNLSKLTENSRCDNVVLEWRLAKELHERGMIGGIFPVLIGDKDPASSSYSDYFTSSCHPSLRGDVVVPSIENKAAEHLEREKLGPLKKSNMSIKDLLKFIGDNQGQKIGSDHAEKTERFLSNAIEMAANSIDKMVKECRNKLEEKHPMKWRYDIKDEDRGDDGYWKYGNYKTDNKEKTCSLFTYTCAMGISYSIATKKKLIPVMEKRDRYGFPSVAELTNNLPNQFSDHVGQNDVLEYEVRGQYKETFYANLAKRIINACNDKEKRKPNDKNNSIAKNDDYNYHVFLIFSVETKTMAEMIMAFFSRKDKNVKFCTSKYDDDVSDIKRKMLKSEKQIILTNNLASVDDSVEMCLKCLVYQLQSIDQEIDTNRKPLNFVFVRDKSAVDGEKSTSTSIDLEDGGSTPISSYFSEAFKNALQYPSSTVSDSKTFRLSIVAGGSNKQKEGRKSRISNKEEDEFFKTLLQGTSVVF